MKLGEPCRTCRRPITEDVLRERRRRRSAATKSGLAKSDKRIGRPRSANYGAILSLREKGHSLSKIADILNVSRGAVQHCLRLKEKGLVEQAINSYEDEEAE